MAVIVAARRLFALGRGPGVGALMDQGVVSLGAFATNIVLARALPVAEYGTFAILLGVVYFFNGIHNALIVYPLSVMGAAAETGQLRRLAVRAVVLTIALNLLLGLTMLAITALLGRLSLAPWIIGALLFWQIQETLRRSFAAQLRYHEALWGNAISHLGRTGLIWGLVQGGKLSLEAAFGAVILAAAVGGALQALQLDLRSGVQGGEWRRTFAQFWRLGYWLMLANLTAISHTYAVPWVLAVFHGPQQVAAFEALATLLKVSNPVMTSALNLIVPAAAQARAKSGIEAAKRLTARHAITYGALIAPYFLFLFWWPRQALGIFYGEGSAYLTFDGALRVFVLGYGLLYLAQVLGTILLAFEKSRYDFLSHAANGIAALSVGLPMTALFGVMGAVWGGLLSLLVRLATILFFLGKADRESRLRPGLGGVTGPSAFIGSD